MQTYPKNLLAIPLVPPISSILSSAALDFSFSLDTGLRDSNCLLTPAAWHCSRSRVGDRKSWMLKGQSPTIKLWALHYHAGHKKQYFHLALIVLYSPILYYCLELQQNIRSLDFFIFTYLHVRNLTSVLHFILHIHTTRYTSKGRRQAAVRLIRCKRHQSFPMMVSSCHHTLRWI